MSRGSPIITLRLAKPVMAGLKELARRLETTPSELIRQHVIEMLDRYGVDYHDKPLDGQMRMEERSDA